jgi:hypothetical protein
MIQRFILAKQKWIRGVPNWLNTGSNSIPYSSTQLLWQSCNWGLVTHGARRKKMVWYNRCFLQVRHISSNKAIQEATSMSHLLTKRMETRMKSSWQRNKWTCASLRACQEALIMEACNWCLNVCRYRPVRGLKDQRPGCLQSYGYNLVRWEARIGIRFLAAPKH